MIGVFTFQPFLPLIKAGAIDSEQLFIFIAVLREKEWSLCNFSLDQNGIVGQIFDGVLKLITKLIFGALAFKTCGCIVTELNFLMVPFGEEFFGVSKGGRFRVRSGGKLRMSIFEFVYLHVEFRKLLERICIK